MQYKLINVVTLFRGVKSLTQQVTHSHSDGSLGNHEQWTSKISCQQLFYLNILLCATTGYFSTY